MNILRMIVSKVSSILEYLMSVVTSEKNMFELEGPLHPEPGKLNTKLKVQGSSVFGFLALVSIISGTTLAIRGEVKAGLNLILGAGVITAISFVQSSLEFRSTLEGASLADKRRYSHEEYKLDHEYRMKLLNSNT